MRSHWLKSERESLRLEEAGVSKEVYTYFFSNTFISIYFFVWSIYYNHTNISSINPMCIFFSHHLFEFQKTKKSKEIYFSEYYTWVFPPFA